MRVVVALGGNALLERGERPDAALQRAHVNQAVSALAVVARDHDLVVTHGNGPQVGVFAEESERDASLTVPYPFDVLGAETQGMIGYWLAQALDNALPGRSVASLVGQTVVRADDPAFERPTKFVGPIYDEATARARATERRWSVAPDGTHWRRVVPSPEPLEIVELPAISALLDAGLVVVCTGGGGIPVVRTPDGELRGVEAVIDKDLTAALLARTVGADALVLLTDVPAVQRDFGTPQATTLGETSVHELRSLTLPPGSMGPKVDAVCRFIEGGGRWAAIGQLADAPALLRGDAGTFLTH